MNFRKSLIVSAVCAAIISALTMAPGATAQQDICVSVNGKLIYQYGSAACESDDTSTSIAIGDESQASSVRGSGNTIIAIGDNNRAILGDSDGTSYFLIGPPGRGLSISGHDGCAIFVINDDFPDPIDFIC